MRTKSQRPTKIGDLWRHFSKAQKFHMVEILNSRGKWPQVDVATLPFVPLRRVKHVIANYGWGGTDYHCNLIEKAICTRLDKYYRHTDYTHEFDKDWLRKAEDALFQESDDKWRKELEWQEELHEAATGFHYDPRFDGK